MDAKNPETKEEQPVDAMITQWFKKPVTDYESLNWDEFGSPICKLLREGKREQAAALILAEALVNS